MRWKEAVLGLTLLLAPTLGCKQQCFLTEPDYDHYRQLGLPNLECDPAESITPADSNVPAPADVLDPARKIHYLSLAEALALALEQGTIGIQNADSPGFVNDNLVVYGGRALGGSDSVRVLSLDPAVVGTDIESSLSKFDARWITSMTWQRIDEPIGGNILTDFNNGDHATFSSSLLKPLPTGGVAGITFATSYLLLSSPPPGTVNPEYRPMLQFQFEQPLLQGFGVEINQLRAAHPGSILTPFTSTARTEGILLTRVRFDEQRAEFERSVHHLLLNVEVAYWNLYGAYWNLYSREQGLRQAYELWRTTAALFATQDVTRERFAQVRQQYELFRGQRIAALDEVLERERQLRGLLGLPVEDGTRLVPIDEPTLAPYQPDWHAAVHDALTLRPELVLARQDMKARQLDLLNQKNLLLPDLRFFSNYDLNGLGTHLDGGPSDPNNAFSSLASNQFHDWTLGLRLDVPLGFRDAHAAVRTAQLRLAQSYVTLREQESKAESFLALQYRRLSAFHEQMQALRAQREAAAVELKERFDRFLEGSGTLEFLLDAQRAWADALSQEYTTIVAYNNALAGFEFAKGTILQHDNVFISEGPLPPCAQVRAVEHERQRSLALVVRERDCPIHYTSTDPGKGGPVLPELPAGCAPPLPAVLEEQGLFTNPPDAVVPQPQGQEVPPIPADASVPPSGQQYLPSPTVPDGSVTSNQPFPAADGQQDVPAATDASSTQP